MEAADGLEARRREVKVFVFVNYFDRGVVVEDDESAVKEVEAGL